MSKFVRAHLVISGRVQGVLFRAGAQAKARELDVTGWVHNMPDGRVELMAEGEKESIEQFIKWCRQGPPLARVKNVEVTYEVCKDEFEDFSIREIVF